MYNIRIYHSINIKRTLQLHPRPSGLGHGGRGACAGPRGQAASVADQPRTREDTRTQDPGHRQGEANFVCGPHLHLTTQNQLLQTLIWNL